MNRKIDELGRITLPKEMRTTLGIDPSDPVNISMEGNKIIITNPNKVDYKATLEQIERYINLYTNANKIVTYEQYRNDLLEIINKTKKGE